MSIAWIVIFRLLAGKPMNGPRWVPVISDRTMTLLPSWRISTGVTLKSGKAVVSSTSTCATPLDPGGWPGAAGMSTQLSLKIASARTGSFLLKASYPKSDIFHDGAPVLRMNRSAQDQDAHDQQILFHFILSLRAFDGSPGVAIGDHTVGPLPAARS